MRSRASPRNRRKPLPEGIRAKPSQRLAVEQFVDALNPIDAAPPGLNRLVLSAEVVARGALRYTPAGLPALDLSLKHESTLAQPGQPRWVTMEIKARAVGDITLRLEQLELGGQHVFAGFLGSQRNGRGIVFHVTELG